SFTGAASRDFRARLESTGRARVIAFPERNGRVHAGDEMLAAVVGSRGDGSSWATLEAPRGESPSFAGLPRPILALHPGSGGARKRAPESLFADLAGSWRER